MCRCGEKWQTKHYAVAHDGAKQHSNKRGVFLAIKERPPYALFHFLITCTYYVCCVMTECFAAEKHEQIMNTLVVD